MLLRKKWVIIGCSSAAIVLFGITAVLLQKPESEPSSLYDAFAKCLAERTVTMYGAEWCPHCQNEKQAFGNSFRFVPYVECPDEPARCLEKGISGYPTWLFPNGKKLTGEQGLAKLSEESGCSLVANSSTSYVEQ